MATSAVRRAAVLVIAAGLLVAGCSSPVNGSPAPTDTPSSGPVSTGAADSNVFGAMDACQVLDQLVAGEGFDPGERISARNECDASKLDFGTYSVAFDSAQGLAEFTTTDPGAVKTSINGRTALQSAPSNDMCVFALEVGPHARALAQVTMTRTKDYPQACPHAQQFAEKLEPLLPKAQ